jgi:uncharacterized membrane protein YecN with MAPEG domain
MSILTIPSALACERSFESQQRNKQRIGLGETGENMLQVKNRVNELELRGKTLCFIVLLALSGEACLYYAVRLLLSEL